MIRRSAFILIIGLYLSLAGCNDNLTRPSQRDLRTGVDRIRVEGIFGNPDAGTSVCRLVGDDHGSLFFTGRLDDEYVVGEVSPSGQPIWTAAVPGYPVDIMCLASSPGSVIVSTYGDPELTVYTREGVRVYELDVDDLQDPVWFEEMATTAVTEEGSTIVAAGGTGIGGVSHPYVAVVDASPSGQLTLAADTVLLDFPYTYFAGLAADTSGTDPTYYVIHDAYSASEEFLRSSVRALSGSLGTLWQNDLSDIRGWSQWAADIAVSEDGVAVVGGTMVEKGDGQEWYVLMARFIELDGTPRWSFAREMSENGESYKGCTLANNELLAVGWLSSFVWHNTTRVYGFGLLSRIDIATGEFIGHMVFGDPDYHSELNDVVYTPPTVWCAGDTEWFIQDGGFRGWFLEVDPNVTAGWLRNSDLAAYGSEGPGRVGRGSFTSSSLISPSPRTPGRLGPQRPD